MSRTVKLSVAVVVVLFAGAMLIGQAQARPNYCKTFIAQYENVKDAKEIKCAVCHVGKEKKDRNIYGVTLTKLLGAKEVKEEAKIKETLKKAESEKSAVDDKTFGDLLKEGKLPASK